MAACRRRGPNIARRVTDEPALAEIEAELARGLKQHPGRRLAARTFPGKVRMVRAEIEGVDARTERRQPPLEMIVQRHDVFRRVEAAGDACLVRDDHDGEARTVEAPDRFGRPWNEREVVGPVEIVDLDVDRSVAV